MHSVRLDELLIEERICTHKAGFSSVIKHPGGAQGYYRQTGCYRVANFTAIAKAHCLALASSRVFGVSKRLAFGNLQIDDEQERCFKTIPQGLKPTIILLDVRHG
jgi:hypothetical protein